MSGTLPVGGSSFLAPVSSQVVSDGAPEARDYTRSVAQAVNQLNASGIAGEGREVLFSVDRSTRLPVVKIVETSTQEVIDQWPPEYALRLAQSQTANNTGDSG
jgi:uncharacterized FlaG/YvyC family protein